MEGTSSNMNSCGTEKFSICRITLSRKSQTACRRATLYHTFHIITCRRVKYINYVIILMAQTVSQTAISRSWLASECANWARLSITKRNMRDDRMLLWSDMNYTTKGRDHKIISWVIYNREAGRIAAYRKNNIVLS